MVMVHGVAVTGRDLATRFTFSLASATCAACGASGSGATLLHEGQPLCMACAAELLAGRPRSAKLSAGARTRSTSATRTRTDTAALARRYEERARRYRTDGATVAVFGRFSEKLVSGVANA